MSEPTPFAEVTVDLDGTGATTHVPVSWSVRREIATDVPAQIQASPGAAVASADVKLAAPDSAPGHFSPFRNRRRRVARPLSIRAGLDGEATEMLFVGRTSNAPGSATDADLDLSAEDEFTRLRQPVELPGLADRVADGAEFGISARWVMDAIAQDCGLHTVPPPVPGCVLSLPLQDSLWPTVTVANFAEYPAASPDEPTFTDGTDRQRLLIDGGYPAGIPMVDSLPGDLSAVVCADIGDQSGDVTIGLAGWTAATLTFAAATVTLTVTGTAGSVSVPYSRGRTVVEIDVQANLRRIRLLGPGGAIVEQQQSTAATTWDPEGAWLVNLSTSGRGVAGVQVAVHGGSTSIRTQIATTYYGHVRQTSLDPSLGVIRAVPPRLASDGAGQVFTDIAEAEFGGIWFDEDGRLAFRNRNSLRGVGVTPKLVTSRDSLVDMVWAEGLESLRSRIEVTAWPVTVRSGNTANKVVWQNSDTAYRIPANQVVRYVIDTDSSFTGMERGITFLSPGDPTPSVGNAVRVNSREDGTGAATPDGVSGSVRQIGPSRFELTFRGGPYDLYTVDGTGTPSGVVKALSIASQPESAQVLVARDNPDLLDTGAETLSLEASPWRQGVADVGELATWLASLTAYPMPTLQNVDIIPDLTIRLGDVVELVDPDVTGLHTKALVVGVEHSGSAGSHDMSLTVRPVAWTVAEFMARTSFATVAEFTAHWAGLETADFTATPLGRPE